MDEARNEVRDYLHDQEARLLAELEEQIMMAQPWDAPDMFDPWPAVETPESRANDRLVEIYAWGTIAIVVGLAVWAFS